jgi:hypothetical protein
MNYRIVGVGDIPHVQPIQRHEGHFAWQLLPVHLLQDLRPHFVRIDNVMEQPVPGRDLHRRVDALLAVEILDYQTIIGPRDFSFATPSADERVQHLPDAVPTVQNRLPRHRPQLLVRLGQVFLQRRQVLLDVVLFAPELAEISR